jgi:2'-5' RNA ligase
MRVFVGLDLPEAVRDRLARRGGGVPGARWVAARNLHITLRFVGEVDGGTFRDIVEALSEVDADPFPLALAGLGEFGGRKQPRAVWAAEGRRYVPHVTLAHLREAAPERVARFLADHADLAEGPWPVTRIVLFSSHAGSEGRDYRVEATFPLGAWDDADADEDGFDDADEWVEDEA